MMADYFGNLLLQPRTVEHDAAHFELAVQMIRQARQEHRIEDMIVTVERTGNYHVAPQRAFAKAGLETRILHPFATKQYRMPADPGNKTDHTDLSAQHRAAVAGFGLKEPELDEPSRRLRLRVRHRRDLVEKASAIACQIREHLHLAMPGYADLFDHFFTHRSARAIARWASTPQAVLQLGWDGLNEKLREQAIRFQPRTLDKILAWADQTARQAADPDAGLHHAIWTDLDDLYQKLQQQIHSLERDLAGDLVYTPYVRLLAIPGINVVSAADFAGEMGPIANYANANAITGRSGLFPSRYQSDQTDQADGAIVRCGNRRLRAAIMRIADNLARHNGHFRGRAQCDRAHGVDPRALRVKIAKSFTRLGFACVAGDQPLRHPCCATPDSILEKLRAFHHQHGTPLDRLLADLQASVGQLPFPTRNREAEIVANVLKQQSKRRRGPASLGNLLPAVLARLGVTGKPKPTGNSVPS
jgi:transposase